VLGAIANFSCKTVTIPQLIRGAGGGLDTGPFSYRTREVILSQNLGNTSTYVFDFCRSYNLLEDAGLSWEQDQWTVAVRAFAFIAITFGILGLCVILAVPYCGATNCRWKCSAFLFLLTGVFQGLCLTITRSSLCTDNPVLQILDDFSATSSLRGTFANECQAHTGYMCGVAATVLWLLTGLFIFTVPTPVKWQDDWCSESSPIPPTDQEPEKMKPTVVEAIER
jgi:hypothetical protein